jgi:hypothetical protein
MAVLVGIPFVGLIFGSHSDWIDSYLFLMKSTLVAIVLDIALKCAPRIQMVGVGLLMLLFVGCQLAVAV